MDCSKYVNKFYNPSRIQFYTYSVFNSENECELLNVPFSKLTSWFKEYIDATSITSEKNIKSQLYFKGYTLKRNDNTDKFQTHMEEYQKEQARLVEQFKNDLYEEYDVVGLKNVEKVFEKAWELGTNSAYEYGSSIYDEVLASFDSLIEIIKE